MQSYSDNNNNFKFIYRICEVLFPTLLAAKKIDKLLWLFRHFSDIPESCFVSTLLFCLHDLEETRRRELLQTILLTPITTDISTLRQLRSELSIKLVLSLLHELSTLMVEFPGNEQLLEWATLLLDAHYQQYLLSKDETVIDQLKELKKVVENQVNILFFIYLVFKIIVITFLLQSSTSCLMTF